MRNSPLRTTLAVLRTELGLTQGEFGNLIGRSRPTVQAIELKKLRLTEDLAAKVSDETGISARWLLEDNPDAPMIVADGWNGQWSPDGDQPSVKEVFEMIRAGQAIAQSPGRKRHLRTKLDTARSEEMYSQWLGILGAAIKDGKQEVAEYLLSQFLAQMKARFGYDAKMARKLDRF